jgi:hypothetical protein
MVADRITDRFPNAASGWALRPEDHEAILFQDGSAEFDVIVDHHPELQPLDRTRECSKAERSSQQLTECSSAFASATRANTIRAITTLGRSLAKDEYQEYTFDRQRIESLVTNALNAPSSITLESVQSASTRQVAEIQQGLQERARAREVAAADAAQAYDRHIQAIRAGMEAPQSCDEYNEVFGTGSRLFGWTALVNPAGQWRKFRGVIDNVEGTGTSKTLLLKRRIFNGPGSIEYAIATTSAKTLWFEEATAAVGSVAEVQGIYMSNVDLPLVSGAMRKTPAVKAGCIDSRSDPSAHSDPTLMFAP